MRERELNIGDLAHCNAADGIDYPFIGKIIDISAEGYQMEIVFIPDINHASACHLHTQVTVAKKASKPFWNKHHTNLQ